MLFYCDMEKVCGVAFINYNNPLALISVYLHRAFYQVKKTQSVFFKAYVQNHFILKSSLNNPSTVLMMQV